MFSAVSSWLGGTGPEEENEKTDKKEVESDDQQENKENTNKDDATKETTADTEIPNITQMGEKTFSAAKEWGGMLNLLVHCQHLRLI